MFVLIKHTKNSKQDLRISVDDDMKGNCDPS